MGETYVIDSTTGEKHIAASVRPDGSIRKAIKVRPGFTPLEEQQRFRAKSIPVPVSPVLPRNCDAPVSAPPGNSVVGLDPKHQQANQNTNKKKKKKKNPTAPQPPPMTFEVLEPTFGEGA